MLLCTFVNPASVVLARQDQAFRQMLTEFNMVLPDGTGAVQAVRRLHHYPAERISFDSTSLAPVMFRLAAEKNLDIVLVGGRPGIADHAARQIQERYPVKIAATFDGFTDRGTTLGAVAHLGPRVVIVGLGSGKQESFLLDLAKLGWHGIGITCGGYLDQLSEGFTYYPAIVDRLNLRFAYRLMKEPKRLWRRYLLDYPRFVTWLAYDMIRNKMS